MYVRVLRLCMHTFRVEYAAFRVLTYIYEKEYDFA